MLADDRDPRHYGGRQAQTLVIDSNQGYSNGPTEAVSPLIKKVKRREHGFRNFANYRLQLLLHYGVTWPTPRRQDCELTHHV
jgi:hypothetical protein